MKNLITRTITGVLYVAIMVAGMMRPDTIILLFALITALTMWEYCGLVNNIEGVRVNQLISTIAATYFVAAVALWRVGMIDFRVFIPYILTVVYLFVEELYLKQQNPVNDWAYTMLGQMYVALPMALVFFLAFQVDAMSQPSFEMLIPLCLFVFLWVNDSGAYCVGSLLGKHKLFPRISPGKSWEAQYRRWHPRAHRGRYHRLAGQQKSVESASAEHRAVDRFRTRRCGLRHPWRPCGESFQAYTRHQGQRQSAARPRWYARPL